MNIIAEATIQKVEHCYTQLLDLYHGVSEHDLTTPILAEGWSVKDTLAQIAAWEWHCAGLLKAARDTNGPLWATPDVDGLNREIYQERRHWSWARIRVDSRQAHRALLRAIRQLPSHRLADDLVQRTIARETWEHYAKYTPLLENVRQ